MTDSDHVIWSNHYLDYEDWREYLEEEFPDMSEDDRYQKMVEINGDYLDDERLNLDIQLSQPIIAIADLGLWHGRRSGYKEIQSGNIKDCLYSTNDYSTWYVDKFGDLRCEDIHHDGRNYYLYRAFKDGVTDEQREEFEYKIYNGTYTSADITRLTRRLGDEIAKVYGWEIAQRGVASRAEAR